MSNCSGKLLSIILAASLTGSAFLIVSNRTARADDTCLSGPKATTPRGSHWYYRVEAGTKRHCWYLGEERGKTAQGKAKPSSAAPPPNKPAETSAGAPMQSAVSDARAEFVDTTSASAPAAPAVSPPSQDAASTNDAGQPADTSKPAVATRWPDPAASVQPPQPTLATAPKPASQLSGERSAPGPAVRTAAAPSPSPQASSYSMPMLLGGLAGALAFAGFLGFTVVKFGSLHRRGQMRQRPESIWDDADTVQPPPPWQTQEAAPAPSSRAGAPRTRQDIEAQSRDILELLARASRKTAT